MIHPPRFIAIRSILILLLFCYNGVSVHYAYGQNMDRHSLQGTIYHSITKKPVSSVTIIIVELKKRAYADTNGSYRITVTKSGAYTVMVSSEGLRSYTTTVVIEDTTIKNFALSPPVIQGQGITITAKRDIQTVSRHTMTLKQMKEGPATFADSRNALTALPGVT